MNSASPAKHQTRVETPRPRPAGKPAKKSAGKASARSKGRSGSERGLVTLDLVAHLDKPAPTGDQICIVGNQPQLGNWNPGRVRMEKVSSTRYRFRLQVKSGTIVECKVTRGSWKTQGVYGDLGESFRPDNCRFEIDGPGEYIIRVQDWMDQLPIEADPIMGVIKRHEGLEGEGLRHPRDVQVWLPPSYRRGTRRYPVLYMHDGQNLFDPAASFAGADWKVDETATRLMKAGLIEEFIVVGIDNTPDRMEEYNLFRPLGKAYTRFLLEVVKPMIDATYRTLPEPENTGVMGSSMGGMISFQLTWFHPEVFRRAGCLSSAFWFTRFRLFKDVRYDPNPRKGLKVYLDCGGLEPTFLPSMERMTGLLNELGYRQGEDLLTYFDPEAPHSEPAWARRLEVPLRFLFGTGDTRGKRK